VKTDKHESDNQIIIDRIETYDHLAPHKRVSTWVKLSHPCFSATKQYDWVSVKHHCGSKRNCSPQPWRHTSHVSLVVIHSKTESVAFGMKRTFCLCMLF